jgi:hypothetical protein
MRRRTALATAGALTLVLLAAAAAAATNLGLLRAGTDTGPVGRLSPADLAPASVDRQAPSGGPTTSSGGGSVGAQGPTGRHEPGDDERLGEEVAGQGGPTGHDGGLSPEHFGGREDDD